MEELNNKRIEQAISKIDLEIKKFNQASLYIHPNSTTPLSLKEKQFIFDIYRHKGYNITPKNNSHGITYFLIS